MCGSDINYQPPATIDYGESMREGLQAQVDLAPDLYAAESSQEYGRPAYARLNQGIMEETLLGKKETYDSEGRIVTGFDTKDGSPPRDYSVQEIVSRSDNQGRELNRAVIVIDSNGKEIARTEDYDTHYLVGWGSANKKKKIKEAKDAAVNKLFESGALEEFGFDKDAAKEAANVITSADYMGGVSLRADGSVTEEVPIYKKDADGNVIQDKSKAGQTTYSGGGMVSNIAGDQEQEFTNPDGTKSTRRAGFNEDGSFAGISALARDLQQLDSAQGFAGELKAIEDNAKAFTEAYRDQGDIKGALNKVQELTSKSAIPETKIADKGNALTNLASSFSTPQITSPYGGGQQNQSQPQTQIGFDASQEASLTPKVAQIDKSAAAKIADNYRYMQETYEQDIADFGIEAADRMKAERMADLKSNADAVGVNIDGSLKLPMTSGQQQVAEANSVGRRTRYVASADRESPEYQGGGMGMSVAQQAAASMMGASRAGDMMSGIQTTTQTPTGGNSQPQMSNQASTGQLTDARGVDRVTIGRGTTAVNANEITSNKDSCS